MEEVKLQIALESTVNLGFQIVYILCLFFVWYRFKKISNLNQNIVLLISKGFGFLFLASLLYLLANYIIHFILVERYMFKMEPQALNLMIKSKSFYFSTVPNFIISMVGILYFIKASSKNAQSNL